MIASEIRYVVVGFVCGWSAVALVAPLNSGRHFLVEMLDYLTWPGRASQHVICDVRLVNFQ